MTSKPRSDPVYPLPTMNTRNESPDTDTDDDESATKLVSDAFERGFANDDGSEPKVATPDAPDAEDVAETPPAKPAKEAKPAETPPVVVDEDPFAGLPPAVRDRLAQVDTLAHSLRTAEGRIAALQRAQSTQKVAAPAPAPATPSVRDAIRGDLPEVADALDELEARLKRDDPPPSAPDPTPEPDVDPAIARGMAELDEIHPDWRKTSNGTDFALWLSAQGQQYHDKVRSTTSAAVVADALTKFEGTRARREAATAAQASRSNRVSAAARLPNKASASPGEDNSTPEDEEERAMAAGFRGT